MSDLRRRDVLGGLCSCSALALAACAAPVPAGQIEPGYRPDFATDEGGLWQVMAKAEDEIKRSHGLVRDADLNAYVRDIVCRLGEAHCVDLRVYILRTPFFNANMAPNGMMQVWTGLLLRTQNEAQLAAILGHEMGHYLERHTLQKWRNTRATTDFTAFLGVELGGVGLGAAGAAIQLAAASGLSAYSRDQERRADEIGFELMTKAGYRPLEASKIWEHMIAEQESDKKADQPSVFFASHPAAQERMTTLRTKAEASGSTAGETFPERYRQHLVKLRPMLLQDELKLRQYDRTLVVLKQLAEDGGEDGEIAYFTGEVYRLRDKDEDRNQAREAFERAIAHGDGPVETYRSLGLLHRRAGDVAAADAAFGRYLELKPNASDREMIRSYLQNRG